MEHEGIEQKAVCGAHNAALQGRLYGLPQLPISLKGKGQLHRSFS